MPFNKAATYAIVVSCGNSNASGVAVTTFHFTSTAVQDIAACNTVINHLKTFYTAIAPLLLGNGYTFTIGSRVTTMEEPPFIVGATAQSVNGSVTGNVLPPQVCAIASWRTSRAGRGYRGRNYLGPIAASACGVSGQLSAGAVSGTQTAMNTLLANINAMSPVSSLCVWSPTRGDGLEITSGVARGKTGTLRTRN